MFLLLALAACSTHDASAPAAPKQEGAFGSWKVLVSHQGRKDMLCYAGASPQESEGSIGARESKPYLMVTRRPSGKLEVSASAGYRFMPGSKVELAIDDDTHSLFYKTSVAWARGDVGDRDIIESMKEADNIELRAVSDGGLTSVDYYPSEGFAEAVTHVRELCP